MGADVGVGGGDHLPAGGPLEAVTWPNMQCLLSIYNPPPLIEQQTRMVLTFFSTSIKVFNLQFILDYSEHSPDSFKYLTDRH